MAHLSDQTPPCSCNHKFRQRFFPEITTGIDAANAQHSGNCKFRKRMARLLPALSMFLTLCRIRMSRFIHSVLRVQASRLMICGLLVISPAILLSGLITPSFSVSREDGGGNTGRSPVTVKYEPAPPDEPVTVGIRVVPPFVIEGPGEGEYSGLTISLWEHIAEELGIGEYRYEEHDIAGLIEGVAYRPMDETTSGRNAGAASPGASTPGERSLFAAASALTITAEREQILDFTHPFFVTGLGIAVSHQPTPIWQAVSAIWSREFLWLVGLLALLLLFWGALVWAFERRANPDQFGGNAAEGIGSGFWWAAVTMTTVGYGDKAPMTLPGRLIGFVWMFAGIILISFFTASIASTLTVSQLDTRVSGPQDLPHVSVGALEHSATLEALDELGIGYRTYSAITDGLRAVQRDEIDAFVHDAPILKYYTSREFSGRVGVLPETFNEQYYGIALPLNSPLRNRINRIMLDFMGGEEWQALQRRYLGD